jgi:hypothetical protein
MCQRVQCERCQKPTYSGCGKHIEQVLRSVSAADRCSCREEDAQLAHAQLTHLAYKPSVMAEQR